MSGRPLVLAVGPRSNGTTILYKVLTTGDTFPLHVPAFEPWFRDRDWAADFPTAQFVIIRRNEGYAAESSHRRGFHPDTAKALEEQREAEAYLTGLAARLGERALEVRYEDLVDRTEATLASISAFTGSELSMPEPIRDENAKYAVLTPNA